MVGSVGISKIAHLFISVRVASHTYLAFPSFFLEIREYEYEQSPGGWDGSHMLGHGKGSAAAW